MKEKKTEKAIVNPKVRKFGNLIYYYSVDIAMVFIALAYAILLRFEPHILNKHFEIDLTETALFFVKPTILTINGGFLIMLFILLYMLIYRKKELNQEKEKSNTINRQK